MDINGRTKEKDSRRKEEKTAMSATKNSHFPSALAWVISCTLALVSFSYVYASPTIEHWTTDNGARVYYVYAPELPMVDIQFIFDGGSARDQDHKGAALLTSALSWTLMPSPPALRMSAPNSAPVLIVTWQSSVCEV